VPFRQPSTFTQRRRRRLFSNEDEVEAAHPMMRRTFDTYRAEPAGTSGALKKP
jgi:hypothetical protein